MTKKGVFICIEGLDGCGKTTQAKLLVRKLSNNYNAIYTAEPTQGKIGAFIRDCCLYGEKRLSSEVEALLFAADRIEHVKNEILPALKEKKIVVSDRYVYSSLAYQGATGLCIEWIEKLNMYALNPDLAIFIDVDPRTTIERLKSRKSVMEKFEIQQEVRKIYLKFVGQGKLTRIDGNNSRNKVAIQLATVVSSFLSSFH